MSDGRHSRGEQTRARLIDAALELIITEGVQAATQRRVAERAGTSLASTTYHFRTAEDLLVAAFEVAAQRSGDAFEARATAVLAGEQSVLDAAMEFAGQAPHGPQLPPDAIPELVMAGARRPRLRHVSQAYLDRMATLLAPLTQPPEAAPTVARCLTGLIIHELEREGPRPSPTLRRDVEQLFTAFGILAAAHSPNLESRNIP